MEISEKEELYRSLVRVSEIQKEKSDLGQAYTSYIKALAILRSNGFKPDFVKI